MQREAATGRSEPAYTMHAKVFNPQIAKEVYKCTMETPITIPQRELLSLAPEVHAQIADVTIKKHIPCEPVAQAMIEEVMDEDELAPRSNAAKKHNKHMPVAYVLATRTPLANTTIIPNPYEMYLKDGHLSNNADFEAIMASDSHTLRVITPVVDRQEKVEAILDPGCQVVAMSEEILLALAIPYDPTICLSMISANGNVDETLGIACNVPFLVGNITLYLQVHVLQAPAYDILLGCPFDVLTKLVIRNYSDENETITICDPNTGCTATVPTVQRGSFHFANQCRPSHTCTTHPQSQDF